MIVIFHKAFAEAARAIMKRSVKLYLFHGCIKILPSVRLCEAPNDAFIKARMWNDPATSFSDLLFSTFLLAVCQRIAHDSLSLLLSGMFLSKIEIIRCLYCFSNIHYIFDVISWVSCIFLNMVDNWCWIWVCDHKESDELYIQYERVPISNCIIICRYIASCGVILTHNTK